MSDVYDFWVDIGGYEGRSAVRSENPVHRTLTVASNQKYSSLKCTASFGSRVRMFSKPLIAFPSSSASWTPPNLSSIWWSIFLWSFSVAKRGVVGAPMSENSSRHFPYPGKAWDPDPKVRESLPIGCACETSNEMSTWKRQRQVSARFLATRCGFSSHLRRSRQPGLV